MPIFGSDGGLVGTVDRVIGVRIRLARMGVSEADQFFIPLSWVANVTDRVTLDRSAADARPASATQGPGEMKRSLVGPAMWTGVGVVGVALLYGASTLIPRSQ